MKFEIHGAGVFLLTTDDALAELAETPFASEDDFQDLVARHPRLIPAALSDEGPSRWLLVAREQGIAETLGGTPRWSVDHLLLDQEAVPTLVEVKRSTDTRLRREVVGQMLDYAAGAVAGWRASDLREVVDTADPEALVGLLGPDADADGFWEQVEANLRAGRLRLVFLADRIPPELERIVEFLDAQMDLCEVRAVELRRFAEPGGTATIVTRPMGKSVMAPSRTGRSARTRQWDEPTFLTEVAERHGPAAKERMCWFIDRFRERKLRLWYGTGASDGSLIPIRDLADGRKVYSVAFWTYGAVEVQFQYMHTPLNTQTLQEKLAGRLERIPGVQIPRERLGKRPSFPLALVLEDEPARVLLEQIDWCLATSEDVSTSTS